MSEMTTPRTETDLADALNYDARGLVPVIAQDADSGEVLMLAYANREAVRLSLATGQAHYWSRSRGELWRKGATSGHTQQVVEVRYDCDEDALLFRVRQTGAACHTGERSCFYRGTPPVESDALGGGRARHRGRTIGEVMALLERVVDDRLAELPEGSYVTQLHRRGLGYIAQKVVEEAGESIVAALEGKDDELIGEAADLLFHLSVLLRHRGVGWSDVAGRLAERHRRMTE